MKVATLLLAACLTGCAVFTVRTEPVRYCMGDTPATLKDRNPQWADHLRPSEPDTLATWQWRGLFTDAVPETVFHFKQGRLVAIEDRHGHTPRVCHQPPAAGHPTPGKGNAR